MVGKIVKEERNARTIAMAVKTPNNLVGKKFEITSIEKPVAIVAAV